MYGEIDKGLEVKQSIISARLPAALNSYNANEETMFETPINVSDVPSENTLDKFGAYYFYEHVSHSRFRFAEDLLYLISCTEVLRGICTTGKVNHCSHHSNVSGGSR